MHIVDNPSVLSLLLQSCKSDVALRTKNKSGHTPLVSQMVAKKWHNAKILLEFPGLIIDHKSISEITDSQSGNSVWHSLVASRLSDVLVLLHERAERNGKSCSRLLTAQDLVMILKESIMQGKLCSTLQQL